MKHVITMGCILVIIAALLLINNSLTDSQTASFDNNKRNISIKTTLAKRETMNKDTFWSIIDYAKQKSGNDMELREAIIRTELQAYSKKDICRFGAMVSFYTYAIEDNKGIQNAYSVMDGSSATDDTVHYFCQWLVSEGKDIYMQAL